MATKRLLKLNTGVSIPALGLGTWQSAPNEVYEAVLTALKTGYRHIDTAYAYENEAEVGKAIRDSGIPREEIFLTTKLWGTFHTKPEENLDISLKNLGLDYVDLYLMHWPIPFNPEGTGLVPHRADGSVDSLSDWDFIKTWELMQKIPSSKAKAIGVSNFSIKNLTKLLAAPTTKVVPAANQVELHPYLPQHKLVDFCKSKGIVVTAYSPLGSTSAPLQKEPVVQKIAEELKITAPQVLISWAISRGTSVLPKSVTPERIVTNFNDVELDAEKVAAIDEIYKTTSKRIVNPPWGDIFNDEE
ncbi:Aldo/keto reductase [Myxozyma melibiosi]|uniref:Aldo/keto reductase n=1 Tax=Myxozyma melibiosi TaxID=54550 RepID=A0ABR1F147_9ASCO